MASPRILDQSASLINPGPPTTPASTPIGYSAPYGGIPQVPNLIDVYGTTLGANKQFLPDFTNLGAQITGANQQQALNNLRTSIPGYDASVSESMKNIGALQRGQIPLDVRNQITQQAAERGIATGLYDSPNANAALLSALGLTSLGLQGEGEKEMTGLVNRTPQVQPFDISKLLMSPTDLYESRLLANMYGAAPVPAAAARQMITDSLAGYNRGRSNVPPDSSPGAGTPNLTPPSPTPPRAPYDPLNPPAVGGTGRMEWDPQMGMYWNPATGQYVSDPAAVGQIDFSDVTGPNYDTAETAPLGASDFYEF